MYPGHHAKTSPEKAAAISARTGEVITYAELDARSNRLAQLLWAEGLRRGDHLAVFLENHLRYFEVAWAALRSGLYLTTVNRYLTAPEAGYIVDDCGAQVLVSSRAVHEAAAVIPDRAPGCRRFLVIDGPPEGAADRFESYEAALVDHSPEPLAEEPLGEFMLYSSGTTGRPKGITRPLSDRPVSRGACPSGSGRRSRRTRRRSRNRRAGRDRPVHAMRSCGCAPAAPRPPLAGHGDLDLGRSASPRTRPKRRTPR